MNDIIDLLETFAWWFRTGGGGIQGGAITHHHGTSDDEKTIRQKVESALEKARAIREAVDA